MPAGREQSPDYRDPEPARRVIVLSAVAVLALFGLVFIAAMWASGRSRGLEPMLASRQKSSKDR
jgi:hypothetical protein